MRKPIIFIILVIIVALGSYMVMNQDTATTPTQVSQSPKPPEKTSKTASFSGVPLRFIEGVHFETISATVPTSSPKITEYISYYCPHCLNMEVKYLSTIKKLLDQKVAFEKRHVDFVPSPIAKEVVRAMATMQVLGVENQLTMPMFNAVQDKEAHDHKGEHKHDHSKAGTLSNRADIRALFIQHGVSANDYDQAVTSQAVSDKLSLWAKDQQRLKISGVPAFIINEKYLVKFESVSNLQEAADLMNYLALTH